VVRGGVPSALAQYAQVISIAFMRAAFGPTMDPTSEPRAAPTAGGSIYGVGDS